MYQKLRKIVHFDKAFSLGWQIHNICDCFYYLKKKQIIFIVVLNLMHIDEAVYILEFIVGISQFNHM